MFLLEMRDPLRDGVRATMHDGSGAAMLDGQRAGVHHRPGKNAENGRGENLVRLSKDDQLMSARERLIKNLFRDGASLVHLFAYY